MLYDSEFHKTIESDEIPQAERLAQYISTNINPHVFMDFGCSTGIYLREVQKHIPFSRTCGIEFSKDAVANAVCPNVLNIDLTVPFSVEKSGMTLGLCLEVLEHIDDSQWRPVLQNIVNKCDILIFSAAFPGQGGVGHINCRPKIDWIKRFYELGWVVDLDKTKEMYAYMDGDSGTMGWFMMNAMVLIPYKSCTY